MGVHNLWKLIKPHGKLSIPVDKRLAIDASIWIKQVESIVFKSADVSQNQLITQIFIKRIIKLFYSKIDPIFVFDGSVPRLKLDTIKARNEALKAAEEKRMIKALIEDKKCTICNKKLRICEHGGELRKEVLEKVDKTVYQKIEEHEYDWGEMSSESEDSDCYYNYTVENHEDPFELKNLDSKAKKLKRLIELRKKRKLPMKIDTSSNMNFIKSQLENVKRRNSVNVLVKELNKGDKRILSDCRSFAELRKEEDKDKNYKYSGKDVVIDIQDSKNDKKDDFNKELESYKDFLKQYEFREIENTEKPINKISEEIKAIQNTEEDEKIKKYLDSKYKNYTQTEIEVQKTFNLSNSPVLNILVKLLNLMKINYVVSETEADAKCAALFRDGIVDGIISEDNDLLLYKSTVYKNFFSKNKDITMYSTDEILNKLEINLEQLIVMSLLLGSDYCRGIKNIGPIKALELVKTEEISQLLGKNQIETALYSAIKDIYNNESVKSDLSEVRNEKISRRKLFDFLEEQDLQNIDELTYHLEKLGKL
ncbi:exonuclease I [Nucleospora cyclopteri]